MKGEFQNRDNDELGLGDVPEDLGFEHGAGAYFLREGVRNPIGDIQYQNIEALKPSEPGTIPFSGEVISTYDSRPINSLDFNHTDYVQWNITGAPPTALSLSATYNIPGGYRGVLRGFRYEMDPIVPITYNDLLLDIFVDGIAQLGYQGLRHGQVLATFVPLFILADDGSQITFRWRAPTGIASNPGDIRYLTLEFYGNLLQTTGAPLQLEIANKEVGLPVKTEMANGARARASMLRSRPGRPTPFRRFRFFR